MDTTLVYGVAAVPAIIGLVQVAKEIGMPVRFTPALAVVLGILAGLAQEWAVVHPTNQGWINAVFSGIALGLAACGLYAGAKTIVPTPTPAVDPATPQPTVIRGS